MPHHDARGALHNPNSLPRRTGASGPPVRIDVDRLAARAAAALARHGEAERAMYQRVYVERLLDYLEERHGPADVDAAVARFVEALRSRLGRDVEG